MFPAMGNCEILVGWEIIWDVSHLRREGEEELQYLWTRKQTLNLSTGFLVPHFKNSYFYQLFLHLDKLVGSDEIIIQCMGPAAFYLVQ